MKRVSNIAMLFVFPAVIGVFPAVAHALPAGPSCTCRNRDGKKYELGQTSCIRVGGVAYLARCEMELNVTTWRKVQDGCPEAGAERVLGTNQ